MAFRQHQHFSPGGPFPISHFYLTGSKGDGNGNSRSQPPQGTGLNGRSPSPSVRNQPQHTTQSSKLCLSSRNVLHTTQPSQCSQGGTCRAWQASPPCLLPVPHGQDAGLALPSPTPPSLCRDSPARSSVGLQVHRALTFHSQLMAGEIQCPTLLRLQLELPETSPALTQLKGGSGGRKEPFQPSLHQSFLHLPPQRLLTRNDVDSSSQCSAANSQGSALK